MLVADAAHLLHLRLPYDLSGDGGLEALHILKRRRSDMDEDRDLR